MDFADRLLRPERVAIVGASGDVKKNNSRPQRYLRKHGFAGTIYPINRKNGDGIQGGCLCRNSTIIRKGVRQAMFSLAGAAWAPRQFPA